MENKKNYKKRITTCVLVCAALLIGMAFWTWAFLDRKLVPEPGFAGVFIALNWAAALTMVYLMLGLARGWRDLLNFNRIEEFTKEMKDMPVPGLLARINHPSREIRISVILILAATHKHDEAIWPLIELLKDKSEAVRMAALKGLWETTEEDFGKDYNKWKKWYETRHCMQGEAG